MAADQNILREYLLSLGFRINTTEQKKFDGATVSLDKRMLGLGKTVLGVGTAVVAMTTLFARQMERLYYSSRYANTTAGNMQALEFGAQQIGLKAGQATSTLKAFSAAIRGNPGLTGLLNNLGVKVTGRDKADVLADFIGQLKKMPFYVAQRYASLFGMDAETLFNMQAGLDIMKQQAALRKKLAADAGLDVDAAAKAAVEYDNAWRGVYERVGIVKDLLSLQFLPTMRDISTIATENLDTFSKWLGQFKTIKEVVKNKKDGDSSSDVVPKAVQEAPKNLMDFATRSPAQDIANATGQTLKPISAHAFIDLTKKVWGGLWSRFSRPMSQWGKPMPATAGSSAEDFTTSPDEVPQEVKDPQSLFAQLEKKYGLPPGLLDRIWARESSRGKNMVSPKGAEGHFQFMPKTQQEYGLDDPYDLTKSADAAARKMRDELRMYKGNLRMAAAAYNLGDGNFAKLGYDLGRVGKETGGYVNAVAPVGAPTVNQETNINIHGVNDPKQAADLVAKHQQSVSADLVRNFKPIVR